MCLSSCFFDHLEFILLPSVVRVLKNQLLQDQAIFLTTISIQVFLSVVKVPRRFDSRDHTQKNLTKFDCSHRFYEVMFRFEHRDVFTFPSRTNILVEHNCKIRSVPWRKKRFQRGLEEFSLYFLLSSVSPEIQ